MNTFRLVLCLVVLAAVCLASPLSNSAKNVIPQDVQQIIVVDYKAMNNSPSAQALKDKVIPQQVKDFEDALKASGVDPTHDVDQIAFASFRVKDGLSMVGVAAGNFTPQKLSVNLRKQKIVGAKYRNATIFPMSGGLSMALVDPTTMVFGMDSAVKAALDARDGEARSLNSNSTMTDMAPAVEGEALWSVLDGKGTQTMLKSALGDAGELADYETVKNRLKGSRYKVNFENGVTMDLDVLTSDSMSAATLSGLLKTGVMFKKATASDTEKVALDALDVTSSSGELKLKFKTDDKKFQSLLSSDLFAAVSK